MKLITFSTAFALWLLAGFYTQAQENDHDTKTAVERLNSLKEQIIQEEKDALKFSVENINKRFESGNITEAEAEILKQKHRRRRRWPNYSALRFLWQRQ